MKTSLKSLPYKAFNRLRQTKTCQQLLTPFGRPITPQKWIFIVGCYNSGTTILDHILAQHPLVSGLPEEGVWLTDALPRPEDFGWTRMWFKCLDKVRIGPEKGLEKRAERIKRQWSIWYPKDPVNCLEKSVANATRMEFLQEYFKPAYFIHIIRNGYAVAEGIRRKSNLSRWKNPYYKTTYPITLCAEQWVASDRLISHTSKKLSNFLEIYYEDLCSQPALTMTRITDFLKIEPLPSGLFGRKWTVHEKVAPLHNMNESSFKRLSVEDIEKINHVAGDCLAKHGYRNPLGNDAR